MTESRPLLERVEELVRRRSTTDRRMGYAWMIVPILPVLVAIALVASFIGIVASTLSKIGGNLQQQPQAAARVLATIFGLYGLAILSLYAVLLFGAFAFYYLVDRRNNHFRRQQQLFSTLQRYLASKTSSQPTDELDRLAQQAEDSVFEERDRPAGLWSILYLFVTPIVGVILAYNLDQDLRTHEDLQSRYQSILIATLPELSLQPPPPTSPRSHKRDPILFVVLTAITAGLFWIYWFYTLLKDYNEHFVDQALFEDQILGLLKPQPAGKACLGCGGMIPATAKFCPLCGKDQVG